MCLNYFAFQVKKVCVLEMYFTDSFRLSLHGFYMLFSASYYVLQSAMHCVYTET